MQNYNHLTSPLFLVSLCERFVKKTDGFPSAIQKGIKTPAMDFVFEITGCLEDSRSNRLINLAFLPSKKR